MTATLSQTPLHPLHRRLGARMGPFAGYDMPIHYPAGIVAEHLHTRTGAGLFDVSHMGQALLQGPNAAARFEAIAPGDVQGLKPGGIRYTLLLDVDGNILDDLMVTRLDESGDKLFLVVNAGRKAHDFALIGEALRDLQLTVLPDRALLAVQGPRAAAILARLWPQSAAMPFMSFAIVEGDDGEPVWLSRSGYTGEDGFEISLAPDAALRLAERLLADPDVKPVGLGARDSLRLEAGLCLYGHDIDATTDPVSASLAWSIGKRRREEGGFPGADRVCAALAQSPDRRRVGLLLEGRAVAREGAEIARPDGAVIGRVTSGTHSPSLNRPIAMGYVLPDAATPGEALQVVVRGKPIPAQVTRLPFVPHRYFRG